MERPLLRCMTCDKKRLLDDLAGRCECGGLLLVEYDWERIGSSLSPNDLKSRSFTMWRYQELLPVRDRNAIVSLGEGGTPLVRLQSLERSLPLAELWVKREEQNPTGSFKARGFSAALSLLQERGIRRVAVPSNGNAASALAAYAARAKMAAYVFVPKDCPGLIVEECRYYGARTYQVDGLIHDAGAIAEAGKNEQRWFNVGTLQEPGRVEGKKTMGFELAEQLGWQFPDVIVYPTGGGSGVIGMWKAFHELRQLGWVQNEFPRFVSVQETGCQPLVDAIAAGTKEPPGVKEVTSSPTGMRVPHPPAGGLLLSILRETNGTAVGVSADAISDARRMFGVCGISASPEGAAALAGLVRLCDQGFVRPADKVVLFNTAHALKYLPWTVEPPLQTIKTYEDWCKIVEMGL
ncbi:threonine synthase [Brevibacillus massiliensis]|uniref:threonine synthase n=1 Tax=Brevibacillus massiliensis TaxID=1118054 RepID=UPI0002D2B5BA|nr:threonine synthase [Brevibacillus massiliensis]